MSQNICLRVLPPNHLQYIKKKLHTVAQTYNASTEEAKAKGQSGVSLSI